MIGRKLHRLALVAERAVDRLRGPRNRRRVIDPYAGYATPEHLVVRGRVLTGLRRNQPEADQSAWINFRQMVSLFLTSEVAGVEVKARGVTTLSDEEGYFTLLLPRGEESGWVEVTVDITGHEATATCPVLIAHPDAAYGVISDIDDTMLRTGAYSLPRNLWTSLTGNALTREVFEDAPPFMAALSDGERNPVYYVSSSPWNLHHFLRRIFAAAGLVEGPKFLRDFGLGETQFITGTHGDHKGASIDVILAANPALSFILVGDTGQHDAIVYRDAVARHSGRIRAVVLREPGQGPGPEDLAAMQEISLRVPLLHGRTFDGFARVLRAAPAAD
ncbi:hypothetical protein BOO69_17560 [Sulfitobacter alexandrii]|uniref:Phosphatidate phosphatase APP1 catalytic domain-containing protein n=1 Tax=Sulfitobacter alexandrii TaxID=1917485 RepID=A0A1J0WL13_9RHOB|nr:phosphatase domain-containing protein [Sulfitobacter alexandrii]APE45015.1 hypothetical protein BOO69_17560 [Sulfitobacter alexandrii]